MPAILFRNLEPDRFRLASKGADHRREHVDDELEFMLDEGEGDGVRSDHSVAKPQQPLLDHGIALGGD
jgi:hypothetical protein